MMQNQFRQAPVYAVPAANCSIQEVALSNPAEALEGTRAAIS